MAKPIRIEADIIQKRDIATKKIETDNFTSGSLGAGWRLEGSSSNGLGYLEVDNILVRNTLRTHIFQKDVIKATNGQLYVSDSGVVDSVNTTTSTIYFKVDKSATFSVNDQLKIKDVNDTGVIQTITFTISSVGVEANGAQAYTYSAGVNMTAIQSGMTAVRTSGGAVLIDASTTNSPFIDVLSSGAVKARLGNLAGIAGASGYGLWSDNVFLTGKITATSGSIGGWTIDSTTLSAGNTTLTNDGSINLSDKFTWNGSDLFIGDPTGSYFTYDSNTGQFYFVGTLTQSNLDTALKDELKGDTGVSISSVAQKYAVSSSNSTAPTTWHNTVQTMTTTNKYLWSYQIITYSDENVSPTETPKIVIGVYGEDGQDGAAGSDGQDGVSITGVTTYYLASSASTGVTTETSGWTTAMQTTDTTKKHLWSYQVVSYSNSTTTTIPPIIIGIHGDTGPQGIQGPKGPGVVFRGKYKSGDYYYNDSDRVDVILYSGTDKYYYYKGVTGTVSSWSTADWTQMNNFASVATDILLANNAVINKGLTLGTSGNAESTAFIRSANKNSLSSGEGFYIENTGKFNIGNSSNYVDWNGSTLSINGSGTFSGTITATSGVIGSHATNKWNIGGNTSRAWIYNGKTSLTSITAGVYLGTDGISLGNNATNKITLNQNGTASFGDKLTWDGQKLFVNGDIGGTINKITIGNPTPSHQGIEIGSTGIFAYDGSLDKSFEIDSSGTAYFRGNIEAGDGKIGDLYIGSYSDIQSLNLEIDPNSSKGLGFNHSRSYSGGVNKLFTFLSASTLTMERTNNDEGTWGVDLSSYGLIVGDSTGTVRTVYTQDQIQAHTGLNITANNDIYIKAGIDGTGYAWVSSGAFNGGINYKIDNSADAAPSTRIIKKEITEISQEKMISFLDKIEVREYTNLLTNKKQVSLIIEDEEEKENPFASILFSRNKEMISFKNLPDFLRDYENDPDIITSRDGNYLFSPKVYDKDTLLGIAVGSIKINHNRLKIVEEQNNILINENIVLNNKVKELEEKILTLQEQTESLIKDIKKDNENVREENKLLRERLRIIEENLQELNKKWAI